MPLFGHSLGLRLGEKVDGIEESEGYDGELGDLRKDFPALTLRGAGAGSVRAERDPVS